MKKFLQPHCILLIGIAIAVSSCTRKDKRETQLELVQKHKDRIAEIDRGLEQLRKEYQSALNSRQGPMPLEEKAAMTKRLNALIVERRQETAAMFDADDILKHPELRPVTPRPSPPSPTPR